MKSGRAWDKSSYLTGEVGGGHREGFLAEREHRKSTL